MSPPRNIRVFRVIVAPTSVSRSESRGRRGRPSDKARAGLSGGAQDLDQLNSAVDRGGVELGADSRQFLFIAGAHDLDQTGAVPTPAFGRVERLVHHAHPAVGRQL